MGRALYREMDHDDTTWNTKKRRSEEAKNSEP